MYLLVNLDKVLAFGTIKELLKIKAEAYSMTSKIMCVYPDFLIFYFFASRFYGGILEMGCPSFPGAIKEEIALQSCCEGK